MLKKSIPETKACQDYQVKILKSLELSASTVDYFTRRVKQANQALLLVFGWICENEVQLSRPLAELTNRFIKDVRFAQRPVFEQALVKDIYRRTIELLRKDAELFYRAFGNETLTGVVAELTRLGEASRQAHLNATKGVENGTV